MERQHELAVGGDGQASADKHDEGRNHSQRDGVSISSCPTSLGYNGITLVATLPELSLAPENSLKLGYSFLHDYRTVWNFKKRTLTLLRRESTR
jgi:hypothetical protein